MTQDQASATPPTGDGAADAIRMHAAVDARRRDRRMAWWEVAVEADLTEGVFRQMARGVASAETLRHAQGWLEDRHTAPSPVTPISDLGRQQQQCRRQ